VTGEDLVATGCQCFGELGADEPAEAVQSLHLGDLLVDTLGEEGVPLLQLVRHPLLVEARAEPGVEQHRIERLGR